MIVSNGFSPFNQRILSLPVSGLFLFVAALTLLVCPLANCQGWDHEKPLAPSVIVDLGAPQVFTMEQAHYLLERNRALDLGLLEANPGALNPNDTVGVRATALQTLFTGSASFDQSLGVKNRAAISQFNTQVSQYNSLFNQRSQLLAQQAAIAGQIVAANTRVVRLNAIGCGYRRRDVPRDPFSPRSDEVRDDLDTATTNFRSLSPSSPDKTVQNKLDSEDCGKLHTFDLDVPDTDDDFWIEDARFSPVPAGQRITLTLTGRYGDTVGDYWNIPATQPAFVPRPLEDDDLTFEPKTLPKKAVKSATVTAVGISDAGEDEPIETGFSLGD